MILHYSEDPAAQEVLRTCMPDHPVDTVPSRESVVETLDNASVAVVAFPAIGSAEAGWLRHTFRRCPGAPGCVVLTPLRIGSVQQLRTLDEDRFHTVWAEEAGDRLAKVVRKVAANGTDPIRILGRRIVRQPGLPPLLRDIVSHICRLSIGIRAPAPSSPPEFRSAARDRLLTSLGRQSTGLASSLEQLWTDRPLDRRSEQLFGWALLLHACGEGGRRSHAFLDGLGLPRNTLDRCSAHLLGCLRADQQSREVRLRFAEWRNDTVAFGSSHPPPPTTVRDLAGLWFCDPSTLRVSWQGAMPLKCRPKQLLSWSMLFWALRERRRGKPWDAIAASARCRRRTMERYSRVLAGCTLGAAVREPALAVRALWGWVTGVWRPE